MDAELQMILYGDIYKNTENANDQISNRHAE